MTKIQRPIQKKFWCLQSHRFTYNEPMPVESCTQSLCDLALQFGEDKDDDGGGGGGMVRFTQPTYS